MAEETTTNKQEVVENLSNAIESYEKEIYSALSEVLYKNFDEKYVQDYLKNEHDRIMLSIQLLLNDVDKKANEKALEVTQTIYDIFNTVLNQCNDKIKETYKIQSDKKEDGKSQKSEVEENKTDERDKKKKDNSVIYFYDKSKKHLLTENQYKYVKSIKKFAKFFEKDSVANTMIGIFADSIVFENQPTIENKSENIKESELKKVGEENKTEDKNEKPSNDEKSAEPTENKTNEEVEKPKTDSDEKTQPSTTAEPEKEDGNVQKSKAINELTERRINWMKTLTRTFLTAFKTYGKLFTLSLLGSIKNSLMENGGIFAIAFGLANIVIGGIKKVKVFWDWFKKTNIGKRVDDWLQNKLNTLKEPFKKRWQEIADGIKNRFGALKKLISEKLKGMTEGLVNAFRKLKTMILDSKFIKGIKNSKGFAVIKNVFKFIGTWIGRIAKLILTPLRMLFDLVKTIFRGAKKAIDIMKAVQKAGGIKSVLTKIINKTGIISKLMKGLKTFGGIIMKIGGKLLSFIGGFMDLIEAWKRFQVGDFVGGFIKTVLGILQFFPGAGQVAGIVSMALNLVETAAIKIFKSLPIYEKDKAKIDTFTGGDFFNYTKAIGYAVSKLFGDDEEEESVNGIKNKYSEITIKNLGNEKVFEESKEIQKNNINEIIFNSVKNEEKQNYNFEEYKSFDFIKPAAVAISGSSTSLKFSNEVNNAIAVLQNRANILPNKIILAQ